MVEVETLHSVEQCFVLPAYLKLIWVLEFWTQPRLYSFSCLISLISEVSDIMEQLEGQTSKENTKQSIFYFKNLL